MPNREASGVEDEPGLLSDGPTTYLLISNPPLLLNWWENGKCPRDVLDRDA